MIYVTSFHALSFAHRFKALFFFLACFTAFGAGASELETLITDAGGALDSSLVSSIQSALQMLTDFIAAVLFFDVFGIPFLVLWLILGGIFFTLRLGFINFRLFGHAIAVVRGKYSSPDDPGEVTHFQALSAAVSATVGLGNIAGVALAVAAGGPGAVFWMVVAGFFGMTTKCVEVTMGQKYREFNDKGRISGGAFHYLQKGLAEKNLPRLGKFLAVFFAIFCIGGSIGGGNMFQSSQAVSILTDTLVDFKQADIILALILAVSVGVVLIGGIRRIARVAEMIVPIMGIIYVVACFVVIGTHIDQLGHAIGLIISGAFSFEAAGGGMLGALIAGVTRSAFSNEAGLGSAPIAHSAAKTSEPVREGCVALLEPFIDTIVICFISGLVITITGVYQDAGVNDGVLLTSSAFASVIGWFPIILSIAIGLFAYSTMIAWSYYGERAWRYLFGERYVGVFYVIFCSCTFIGGVADVATVVDFSTYLLLAMALPNLLGLYILQKDIKEDISSYITRLKAGSFKKHD